jgi:hypothetical protein
VARKFVPSKHPRDRFGRFTRSSSAQASTAEREQAAQVATGLKPKRGVTGAKASAYLEQVGDGKHRDAVADYTGGGYVDTHKALRAGKTDDASVKAMDAAMVELPDDLVVSRRVPKAQFGDVNPDDLVGLKVTDAAYAPTSIGAVRATKSDVRLRIAVPKGTRAAVNPDTGEIILDRNLDMVVASVDRNPAGSTDVFLTVLPKAGKANADAPKPAPAKPAKKAAPKPKPAPEPDSDSEQPEGGAEVRAEFMKLKVAELQARMRERGLKPGKLRKSELVDALVADETGSETPATEPQPEAPVLSYDERVAAAASGDAALNATPFSLVRTDTHARLGNRNGLSAESRQALIAYRGNDYIAMNTQLRGLGESTRKPQIDELIKGVDQGLAASRLPQDTLTWRGIRSGSRIFGDRADGNLTGFTWREDAYVSSSSEREVAGWFSGHGGVRMRVLTPAGVGAIQLSAVRDDAGYQDEAEIVLERGVGMRVVADRGIDPDGVRDLDVEVIPVNAAPGVM